MANIIEINDLSIPELAVYTRLTEAHLRMGETGQEGLFIAESAKVIGYALDAGYEPVSLLMEKRQIGGKAKDIIARCGDVPVYTASRDSLTALTGYAMTRGFLCAMKRKPLPSAESVCSNARRIAVLENIGDPSNIGAIFRSAAALGMDGILLAPSCCDPLYRRSVRVSMGTVFRIPWTRIDGTTEQWLDSGVKRIGNMGFQTAAMALRDDSLRVDDPILAKQEKLAVFLGSEGDGLATETISACDYTVKIPMSLQVDSLNVAAAAAVTFWQLGVR